MPSSGFFCSTGSGEAMVDGDDGRFSSMLHIYVHHARNIHNICIYDNQDVYAKFSLTCNPDDALSTRTVNGGGKNPEFNERLQIKITQLDAVLKCEIWMLSRIKDYLEDQLLGFALVPLSSIVGKGKITQDFTLSSTDLFHSPAGTVQLTLFFESYEKPFSHLENPAHSITSEVVLLDPRAQSVDPCEYEKFEFPDVGVTTENQKMVSQYFDMAKKNYASVLNLNNSGLTIVPFLHTGASSQGIDDYDMTANSTEKNCKASPEPPKGSAVEKGDYAPHSGVRGSSTASPIGHRSMENTNGLAFGGRDSIRPRVLENSEDITRGSRDNPTSKNGNSNDGASKIEDLVAKESSVGSIKLGSVFTNPLGNINLGAQQTLVQQQIVDMYMKSMQQFTESLAKMKLPVDLDRPRSDGGAEAIQRRSNLDVENKKGNSSRVFYGSRAFF